MGVFSQRQGRGQGLLEIGSGQFEIPILARSNLPCRVEFSGWHNFHFRTAINPAYAIIEIPITVDR
jgi:hypothetical protein